MLVDGNFVAPRTSRPWLVFAGYWFLAVCITVALAGIANAADGESGQPTPAIRSSEPNADPPKPAAKPAPAEPAAVKPVAESTADAPVAAQSETGPQASSADDQQPSAAVASAIPAPAELPSQPSASDQTIKVAPPIKVSPPERISALPEKNPSNTAAPSPSLEVLEVKEVTPEKTVDAKQQGQPSELAAPSGDQMADEDHSSSAPAKSAPPVVLAPELLPDQAQKARALATTEVRPASFQGLTPGESTREELLAKLGDPVEILQQADEDLLLFQVGPFPKIKVGVKDDLVSSIIIHLQAPTTREEVVSELNLQRFRPIAIYDASDQVLGEVYPERGMMFAYDRDSEADMIRIAHVAIEPISGEPFLLRAMREAADEYAHCLADLSVADELSPDNPQIHWIRAIVQNRCGRLDAARVAAERAMELLPGRVDYQLTLIDIQRQQGEHDEALIGLQQVLAAESLSPLGRAEAHLQWGRLLAEMPPHDYKAAMEKATRAVKLAATLTRNTPPDVSRKARELLVESQLSLATILAHGPWQQKYEVVPQWLLSAEQTARELIEKEAGAQVHLLNVYCASLHCLAVLNGKGAPDRMANAAIELGRQLIADAADEDYRNWLEWELGTALSHAAQIELSHGRPEASLRYANNANALMAAAAVARASAPETDHDLGQLYYLLGSISALHKRDGDAATRWYDKALPRMRKNSSSQMRDERGLLGEQLVSVGISYWETGQKNRAVSVTEEGTRLIQEAVDLGALKKEALAIPFGNLMAMHKALGNSDQAQKVADKAAKFGLNSNDSATERR
jgi:hypothetical protein